MVVLCVAIGSLGTQQRAEAWSAGPLFGLDLPYGGAHGMMAENAILWLDSNNLLPAGYLSAVDRQLLRDGASTPDGIWGPGVGLKNTWWWEGALQVEGMIGRDIVEWDIFEYSCTDEPCFTFKDDWENDFDNLMNHEFAALSEWNPIKYWADKAKQDLVNNNRSRAMVHAGYAMHFAQDYLNPPHLGPLLWGSYQEVDWPLELELVWENTDFNYVEKAWSFNDFRIISRCFTSDDAFAIIFENHLLSYRHSTALAWPTLPSLDWIIEQGQPGVVLDQRIANAVMWSEQAAHEVLQYVFDLKPPGGCISPIDFDGDGHSDLVGITSANQIYYTTDLQNWVNIPGVLAQRVVGDFNGDGYADLAGLTSAGHIYYTTNLQTWTNIPGMLAELLPVGDYNGDGQSDLAGITSAGQLYYTTNLQTWTYLPGVLAKWVVGDFNGDGHSDFAGLTSTGQIYYTTDLQNWPQIPGVLSQLVVGDFNGDGYSDLAGLTSAGQIFYTTDLQTWNYIPGVLAELLPVGDFNGDGHSDLAGLTSASQVYYTTDLQTWTHVPGVLAQWVVGDFNGDGYSDFAGLTSAGQIFYTTDLQNWTNIPGVLSELVE